MDERRIACGLAWFGIGLGVVELLAPHAVARAIGRPHHRGLVRVFGAREIAAGVVILAAARPDEWLWTRVAGDVLDGALLGSGMRPDNPHWSRSLIATIAVAPVVVLDVIYARFPAPSR